MNAVESWLQDWPNNLYELAALATLLGSLAGLIKFRFWRGLSPVARTMGLRKLQSASPLFLNAYHDLGSATPLKIRVERALPFALVPVALLVEPLFRPQLATSPATPLFLVPAYGALLWGLLSVRHGRIQGRMNRVTSVSDGQLIASEEYVEVRVLGWTWSLTLMADAAYLTLSAVTSPGISQAGWALLLLAPFVAASISMNVYLRAFRIQRSLEDAALEMACKRDGGPIQVEVRALDKKSGKRVSKHSGILIGIRDELLLQRPNGMSDPIDWWRVDEISASK